MKTLISKFLSVTLIALISFNNYTYAESDSTFKAALRNKHDRIRFQEVELKDLISNNSFEGKYFKIVMANTERVITFNEDEEVVKKAATVYFHLTKAREYFLNNNPDNIFDVPEKQLTVRIEETIDYSNTIHFKTGAAPKYNTAYTIGPSNDFTNPDYGSWDSEIWFFKAEKEKRKSGIEKAFEQVNNSELRTQLASTMLAQDLISTYLDYYNYRIFDQFFIEQHLTSMAISVGIGVLLPFALEYTSKLIAPKKFYLDTALIPEAIYHEYGHIICGKYLGFIKPTAIVEGYPNYISYKISGSKKELHKTGKYATGVAAKNGKSKTKYKFEEDFKQAYAHGSFVFSLLIDLEESFGPEFGTRIVFNTLKYLNSYSEIKRNLPNAVFQAIDEIETNISDSDKFDGRLFKLKAQNVFVNKGL